MREWSRPLWYTMRLAAHQIDRRGRSAEARADFRNVVLAMRTAVPCGTCERHWRGDVLRALGPREGDCASSAAALRWLEDVHGRIMARKAREARAAQAAQAARAPPRARVARPASAGVRREGPRGSRAPKLNRPA